MNGIAFSDAQDIWWLETVGGHHWIARRVPEDHYVTMPNQLGIDSFDLDDAERPGRDHLASPDLRAFLSDHHQDLTQRDGADQSSSVFDPPAYDLVVHTEDAHAYVAAVVWHVVRTVYPCCQVLDGGCRCATFASAALHRSRRPDRPPTRQDCNDVLSSHYQGTVYDPYSV